MPPRYRCAARGLARDVAGEVLLWRGGNVPPVDRRREMGAQQGDRTVAMLRERIAELGGAPVRAGAARPRRERSLGL